MNALYVTVSIPLLLVLAGFNHAHGLTTFGKTNQGTPQPQKPTAQLRACTKQDDCAIINGSTCIKNHCLCGNNEGPANNGKCIAQKQGANHLCEKDADCVDDAHCLAASANKSKVLLRPTDKICVCDEGIPETPQGTCGGESNFLVLPGLVMIITSLSRTLY